MLKGLWIQPSVPPNISYATLEKNTFIVAEVGQLTPYGLRMVKIRVTGETTFDWIDAKYKGNPVTTCQAQATFTEKCFEGLSREQDYYDLSLSAIENGNNVLYSI